MQTSAPRSPLDPTAARALRSVFTPLHPRAPLALLTCVGALALAGPARAEAPSGSTGPGEPNGPAGRSEPAPEAETVGGEATRAHPSADPTSPEDVDALIDAVSIHETRFHVAPAGAPRELPSADEPVTSPLPEVSTDHRATGRSYLHPFLGRLVYPELSFRLSSSFARERRSNDGEPLNGRGRMALGTRADLNLWFMDLRFNYDSALPSGTGPLEAVFKAPFAVGDHHFAPFVAFTIPLEEGPSAALFEMGIGYHVHLGPLGLKLEVSGFEGTPERTRAAATQTGWLGWNGVVSWLAEEHVGVVFEADGTTALLEHTSQAIPKKGDTVVRLLPGLRFFPGGPAGALEIGASGLFTLVPNGYDIPRRAGALLSVGWVFL